MKSYNSELIFEYKLKIIAVENTEYSNYKACIEYSGLMLKTSKALLKMPSLKKNVKVPLFYTIFFRISLFNSSISDFGKNCFK